MKLYSLIERFLGRPPIGKFNAVKTWGKSRKAAKVPLILIAV